MTRRPFLAVLVATALAAMASVLGSSVDGTSAHPAWCKAPTSVQPGNTARVLATRYHLRGRTSRFFNRPQAPAPAQIICPTALPDEPKVAPEEKAVPQQAPQSKTQVTWGGETRQLAARYHLRGRTGHFFGRAGA